MEISFISYQVVFLYIFFLYQVTKQDEPESSFQYFPYLAFAPPGVVEGELVYCNAGSEWDLKVLDRMNISVKDKIVLLNGISASVSICRLTKGSGME